MLELKNIKKSFGDCLANEDVSLRVNRATIHAIVGENGAGKSTAMKVVYGFYNPDHGEILFDGKPVTIRNPHDAIALGIGMVHQHFMLVDNMTVAENIILGAETGSAANLDLDKANADIKNLSDELRLNINPTAYIEDLSVGQQQRVELLKALYRNANFLILDEPTAVLSPQEVEEFFAILRRMKEQGKTIVIITHKLDEVLAISDEVTVMRDGKTVGNVKTSETDAKELARMIVGRDVLLRVEKTEASPEATVLEVKNLVVSGRHGLAVEDVSFSVRAGEIVGIAGIEGNGQTELIETLAGLQQPASGEIIYQSRPISFFDYPTARSLRRLLFVMLIVFSVLDTIGFLAGAIGGSLLAASLLVRTAVFIGILVALKKRSRLAVQLVLVFSAIGLVGNAIILASVFFGFDFIGMTYFLVAAVILHSAFLVGSFILSNRALTELKSGKKSEYCETSIKERKESGIAHIPEDRHRRGLLLNSDLAENSILGVHYKTPVAATAGLMNSTAIEKRVGEIIENFDVRPPNPELTAKSLSGGNQQKLIIGREFEIDPKLLLVSQPTRGVDIGAIEFIHRKLIELRDKGRAVLLVSAELEEVTALADRLLVIREGKIVGEVDPKTASFEEIGLLMTGG